MTMPGLPKVPSADKIDLIDGKVVGLFWRFKNLRAPLALAAVLQLLRTSWENSF
jgi:hypothetical protein